MSSLFIMAGFAVALILSVSLIPLVLKFAGAYGLYDRPDLGEMDLNRRRVHLKPIPRLGGIAIVVSFFAAYLASSRQVNTHILSILVMSLLIFALGAFDDIHPLSARLRFALQIAIAGLCVFLGDLIVDRIWLTKTVVFQLPTWIGFVFSTFVIVGAINTLNMIDGLDGLAGGISVIAITMLSFLHYLISDNISLTLGLSIPVVGAVLGFLKYNTYPARIFMGDNGSNWLGFIIGTQIISALQVGNLHTGASEFVAFQQGRFIPLQSVILCFAIPIFDAAFVITQRLLNGVHPMAADNRHFHHRLLKLGLNQSQSVTLLYFISIALSLSGIIPIAYSQYHLEWLPLLGLVTIIAILFLSLRTKWERRYRNPLRSMLIENSMPFPPALNYVIKIWEKLNKYVILIVLGITPLFAGPISAEIGYVAIPLFLLTSLTLMFKVSKNDFFDSLILTLSCIVVLIANNNNALRVEFLGNAYSLQPIYNGLFHFLFFSTLLFIIVTVKRNYLVLTPTDFLLLMLPVLLILFPENIKNQYRFDIISMRSFVIFLAYRGLEKRRSYSRRHFKLATLLALLYVILTGIYKMRLMM